MLPSLNVKYLTFRAITKFHVLTHGLGYENPGSYVFNTKTKPHKFCKTCGSCIQADFERIKLGETDDPARDILAFNVGLGPRLKARCLFS
jgi:hypothetical protein